jgi:predicted Rossmann fold nucleotide-binding protein DprA/Smf involved in DNA uptake
MKLAIIGSRTFTNYEQLKDVLAQVKTPITLIISGGAEGADALAMRYAREFGYSLLVHYPNRERYGNRCYAVRNQLIVDSADTMLAFHDGNSPGTKMGIGFMKEADKPVHVILTA